MLRIATELSKSRSGEATVRPSLQMIVRAEVVERFLVLFDQGHQRVVRDRIRGRLLDHRGRGSRAVTRHRASSRRGHGFGQLPVLGARYTHRIGGGSRRAGRP